MNTQQDNSENNGDNPVTLQDIADAYEGKTLEDLSKDFDTLEDLAKFNKKTE